MPRREKQRQPSQNDQPLFSNGDGASFAQSLDTAAIGKALHYFASTRSTNDLALEAARSGAPHGALFIADQQTGGRGRSGRSWHSPANRGLLLSLIVRPKDIAPADLGWIPLLAGLASARALLQTCKIPATIKWPNDVVVPSETVPGWRKLGGILCESSLTPGAPAQSFVVIGIGLNLNHGRDDFPPQTKAPPTSVLLETGKPADRKKVLSTLLCQLEAALMLLEAPHGREQLRAEIEAALKSWWTPERQLTLASKAGDDTAPRIEGTFAGLDSFGRLRLHTPTGEQTLADAEILGIRRA